MMNNITKIRRIFHAQKPHLGILDTKTRKCMITCNATLTSRWIPNRHPNHDSTKSFLSTMPLGEIRAQARDEHLREKDLLSQESIIVKSSSSNNEEGKEEKSDSGETSSKPRRLSQVPISEVLKSKHTLRWVEPIICRNSTVREAIAVCIDLGISAMMVIDNQSITSDSAVLTQRGKVVGMATSRDLLRIINIGITEGESADDILSKKVGEYMTPITQVIYARPEETVGMCRSIMAKLGVKCLPILSNGRVEGLITARDMSDFGLDAAEKGGKKHYLDSVLHRVGLSSNTSMAEPPAYIRAHVDIQQNPLFMNVGLAELPHPYKKPESCGMNRRDFGPDDVTDDVSLSEDAHFVAHVSLPDEPGQVPRKLIYAGVADGVGSWREYDVDPREFSHALMQECENVLREADVAANPRTKVPKGGSDDEMFRRILTPAEIMRQAYNRVKADNIVGSSTACIALFDGIRHQLNFSNLGDSGIVVLRHIDSDVAGSLKRDKTTPRTERTSDLRVAFVSQQQLRSFNHPFQLGWTGEEINGENTSFKKANNSCTTSIHIRRGDIIIMATDGLFDNVELEDIAEIALEWEQKNGFISGGDIASREKRWKTGSSMTVESAENIDGLAQLLVEKARSNSLDSKTDSPFAILAKENDIMWSGGMPDDCTIIAMHIVGAPADGVET